VPLPATPGDDGASRPALPRTVERAIERKAPDAAFDQKVRDALRPATAGHTGIGALEDKVLALAREWAQQALRGALEKQAREHASQTDLLQRRIAKLQLALDESEARLRALAGRRDTDVGVASQYQFVQGLARSEAQYEVKLELLSKILEANLELQHRLGRAS
jgi:hypothetical protein